jgi:hypothetical protein
METPDRPLAVVIGVAKPSYGPGYSLKELNVVFGGNISNRKNAILAALFLNQPSIQKLTLSEQRQGLQKAINLLN